MDDIVTCDGLGACRAVLVVLGFLWRNRALDKIVRDNGEERGGGLGLRKGRDRQKKTSKITLMLRDKVVIPGAELD